ncbi:hypothetical protein PUMCH_003034 [Australozyma saopauloensis]|uniref:NTF2 domain-containing protein n=1 Tax=Australozyma saopauloensis TaxID=291208 RepID=A0AAX4HAY5_9ASCO|nr:hypothetical protein PUMCH_003034 [[Candida] saopauloensis]
MSESKTIFSPCNGSDSTQTKDSELSLESIGWIFVKRYYSTYATSIETLYSFYDSKASLIHDGFPTSSEDSQPQAKTVHVATGNEAIKTHYEAQAASTEKSKIVIESANFQWSIGGSILIVVCGSWKKGSSNLWQFLQTFVLSAKGKTVFDVSNDILRFFDLSEDYQEKTVTVDHVVAPSKVEDTPSESTVESKVEQVTEEVKPAEVKDTEVTKAEIPEAKTEVQGPTEKTEETTSTAEQEKVSSPPQTQTWANLAAIEPKISSKVASVPVSTTVVKTTPSPAPKVASTIQSLATVNGNNKFKKEEWYPIYIKQVEVDDEDLKSALIKQFGDIKFFKRSNKAALCDFKNKADQQKALDAKEIVVKGNVILLEPRVHKPFNNFKPDGKKDKKPVKKNGIKKN